ncbi:MAG: polyphosphate polymerase domain-containing protein [Deltaproteobacteria bacterium]|nr:polyphosphate polymerase domain-containing protein [Deltaproteobacteria bacterium]
MTIVRRFNRYELKYVLHVRQVAPLVRDLLHFMAPDEHADDDGAYRVTSLYYDSPDLHFYRAKLDGLRYRRKLRVRVYPGARGVDESSPAFVEIKQRMNQTVQKRRIVLPLGTALEHCAGHIDGAAGGDAADVAAGSEIQYMVRALRLRPTCVVTYRRRAFVGSRYERGMRVTFDTLVSGRTTVLDLTAPARCRPILPETAVVMEIKVDDRVPDWATSLVARHECVLQRVSKYCLSVAAGLRRTDAARTGGGAVARRGSEERWTIF